MSVQIVQNIPMIAEKDVARFAYASKEPFLSGTSASPLKNVVKMKSIKHNAINVLVEDLTVIPVVTKVASVNPGSRISTTTVRKLRFAILKQRCKSLVRDAKARWTMNIAIGFASRNANARLATGR